MLFTNLDTIETAKAKLRGKLEEMGLRTESVNTTECFGRILAQDIISDVDVPSFRRTAMDGYAVICAETEGASEDNPVVLEMIGEVEMGKTPAFEIKPGTCAYVPTGGMFPKGADGLVIIENTDRGGEIPDISEGNVKIAMFSGALPGDNLVEPGEDMKKGETILKSGRKLRQQDIGVLAALGISEVEVYKPLSMTIISTGDELVGIHEVPEGGQVRDINSYTLMAMAQKYGIEVKSMHLLQDVDDILEECVRNATNEADFVAISGGSSVGKKDATAPIINKVASPGVFVHGIKLKPGRPTILGTDDETRTLFVGVPGHPASAIMSTEMIVIDTLRELMGCGKEPELQAVLAAPIKADKKRDTCITFHLIDHGPGTQLKAEPLRKKSGAITMLSQADAYVLLEAGQQMEEGETVAVRML